MENTEKPPPSLPTAYPIYLSWLYLWLMIGGGIVLNLLVCSYCTAHWFLLPPRAYPLAGISEARVLGPTQVLESEPVTQQPIGSSFWEMEGNPTIQTHYLADKKFAACDAAALPLTASSSPPTSISPDCDFDCLLRMVQVPCDKAKVYPLPVPPPPRVGAWTFQNAPEFNHTAGDLSLNYGCDYEKSDINRDFVCPSGFLRNREAEDQEPRCPDGTTVVICDVDSTFKVDGIMGVTDGLTYVHAFGWAQFQVLKAYIEDDSADDRPWCSVAHHHCELFTELENVGYWQNMGLLLAFFITVLALGVMASKMQDRAIILPIVFAMYLVVSMAMLLGADWYRDVTRDVLRGSMTLVDSWGRPHIHPMWNYAPEQALATGEFGEGAAEWIYYHINSHVDYITQELGATEEDPRIITPLLGFYLAGAAGWAALVCAFIALEMFFAKRGYPPVFLVMSFLFSKVSSGAMLCCGWLTGRCSCCRQGGSINKVWVGMRNLFESTGSVLNAAPWHSWYPKAFRIGDTKSLPFPVDHVWDYVLCLPVHIIRAVLDNLSGQDITSPAEKKLLESLGIKNMRLRCLLCSRRSYFTLMILLGTIVFFYDLENVKQTAKYTAYFRQAAGQEELFPHYRCAVKEGNCNATTTDVYTLQSYLQDMAVKVGTGLFEGENVAHTAVALLGWFGNFLALFCVCTALYFWTDFTVSRKIYALGALFAILTPVAQSSLPVADMLDWDRAEESILSITNEVWEEFAFFTSQMPCDVTVPMVNKAAELGYATCSLTQSNNWDLGDNSENCVLFQEYYQMQQEGVPVNATLLCNLLELYREEGYGSRIVVRDWMTNHMPWVKETLHYGMGLRTAFLSFLRLVPVAMAAMPALMQCGVLVKDMFPWRTLPAAMAALPFAFTALFWMQCQVYFHLIAQDSLIFATAITMTFAPVVYYLSCKTLNMSQPMDDQQAASVTYQQSRHMILYAIAVIFPLMIVHKAYQAWGWSTQEDSWGFRSRVVKYNLPAAEGVLTSALFTTFYLFVFILQAGVDWFINEMVEIHVAEHVPAVVAASSSKEEMKVLQHVMGTSIDTDSIQEGTWFCGSVEEQQQQQSQSQQQRAERSLLEDVDGGSQSQPERLWRDSAKDYALTTTQRNNEIMDAVAAHERSDPSLPEQLFQARFQWLQLLNRDPTEADQRQNYTDVSSLGQTTAASQVAHPTGSTSAVDVLSAAPAHRHH